MHSAAVPERQYVILNTLYYNIIIIIRILYIGRFRVRELLNS